MAEGAPENDEENIDLPHRLTEEVKDAVSTLSEDDPPEAVRQLLESPQGQAVFQQMVTMAIAVHEERHSGPLPAPKTLHGYEKIVPGGAERIFLMAEKEQQHRHERENHMNRLREKAVDHVRDREFRGQVIGGFLATGVLALSAYLIWLGEYGYGVSLCASTMVAIAAVFATRKLLKKPSEKHEASDE